MAADGTTPIMGHPPATTSDLTFSEFLTTVHAYNTMHRGNGKGVKLDFKDPAAVDLALTILESIWGVIGMFMISVCAITNGVVGFNCQHFPIDQYLRPYTEMMNGEVRRCG